MVLAFGSDNRQLELSEGWECVGGCQQLAEYRDRFHGRQWLQQFKVDIFSMMVMRNLLARNTFSSQLCRMTNDDVVEEVANLLSWGALHVHAKPKSIGANSLTIGSVGTTPPLSDRSIRKQPVPDGGHATDQADSAIAIAGRKPKKDAIQSGGGASTITKQFPSQTPNITTIDGPKDLGCGSFDWTIWWDLPKPADKPGWIIQELTATFDARNADGSEDFKKTYHYWEAWPVETGKKISRFQDKKELPAFDDQYMSRPPRPGTKGTVTYVGKAKFFEGDLPPEFRQGNPDTIAGDLFSTTKRPDFCDGSGIDHNLTASWDCTAKPGTSSVSAIAGSETIKGRR